MNLMTAMPRFAPSAAMTALLLPPELISALSSVSPLGRPGRARIETQPEGQVGRGELAEGRRRREAGERIAVRDIHGRGPEPQVGRQLVQCPGRLAGRDLVQLDLGIGTLAEQHV